MHSTRRIIVLTLIVVCSANSHPLPAAPANPPPNGAPAERTPVSLHDETGSPRQAEGVIRVFAWAVARYETAGLVLTEATVTFHRERTSCRGLGGYWTAGDERDRIDICVGGDAQRGSMLLHELAHAWADTNLSEERRTEFVSRRGLETWSDADVDWGQRGIEQVAMIIAWGLEERCELPDDLHGMDGDSLAEEFTRLTSRTALCR